MCVQSEREKMGTLKNYNQFKCNVTQEGGCRTTNRINQKGFFAAAAASTSSSSSSFAVHYLLYHRYFL